MTSDFLTAFVRGVNTGQGGAELAALVIAGGGIVVRYLLSKRSPTAGQTTPVAIAVAPPLIDPKQVEQLVEIASGISRALDGINAGQMRVEQALGRVETAARDAAQAALEVERATKR